MEEAKTKIQIPEVITVGNFAKGLGLPVSKVIGELMKNGVMATINETIDFETAAIIGADLGFEVEPEIAQPDPSQAKPAAAGATGKARPPVVAVMGHVDHGKTSLLDAVRNADVATGEAGGITQHIGAYQIKRKDRWITFLDTPGHEAFSALRAHGAKMTDVAVIVVAADDGVKPQTVEAIDHAKRAGVQMVIALNKVDKEGANPERVKKQLSDLGLVAEEWGGKTVMVEISAKQGKNIDKLLDLVLLVADIEELKAREDGPADGVIIESHLSSGRGPVATLLVQNGALAIGDFIVAGGTYAKVRSLEDWHGKRIKRATPGMPVVVTGLKAMPAFGDLFAAAADEKEAKERAMRELQKQQAKSMVKAKPAGLAGLQGAMAAGETKELNLLIKADVQGSLESLLSNLEQIGNEEVAIKIISSGVGGVAESDITLAKATGAMVLGFNTGVSSNVRQLAVREQVQVKIYQVIYELLDDVRAMLSELLPPELIEHQVAELEVLGVFKTTKSVVICGGKVISGQLEPKLELKIKRGSAVIGSGRLTSLQKDKQPAKKVAEGELCGMEVATTTKIEVGDRLEFVTKEERKRSL